MRQTVIVPQDVVDEHSLVAQTYAGYLFGHPVRAERYTTPLPGSVHVDWKTPWVEPNPIQDDCVFCVRLTDAEAERRVFGFQAAIDKEVMASKWKYLNEWVGLAPAEDIPVFYTDGVIEVEQPDGSVKSMEKRDISSMASHPRNRRAFIERHQYVPLPEGDAHTATYLLGWESWETCGSTKNGWRTKAAPIVSLPLRIKRKMCIDWNHVYTRFMAREELQYDFDTHEFYREKTDEPDADFLNAWLVGGL